MMIFRGNRPGNVSKAAKYSVVHEGPANYAIRLIYPIDRRDRMLLTTKAHPELVRMVNAVKEAMSGVPCGPFYVNEYRQVVVPTEGEYYLAGTYAEDLIFKDESVKPTGTVGPKPKAGTAPGSPWNGPRPGIPYVLAASGDDVYFETEVAKNRVRKYPLSEAVGKVSARGLARRLAPHKGAGGGRIYINEACEFFAPVLGAEGDYDFRYLGPLGADLWFPLVPGEPP